MSTANPARLLDALEAIDPASLDYDEWLRVGQALHAEGFGCDVWDEWSRSDGARYDEGRCADKWEGFDPDGGITGGTIVYLAQRGGWDGSTGTRAKNDRKRALGAPGASRPNAQAFPVLDLDSLPAVAVGEYPAEAEGFAPDKQLREYVRHVFRPGELVNVVTETDRDGKPWGWGTTVDHDTLTQWAGDVLANCDPATGAWLRVNPVCDAETLEQLQRQREAEGKKRRCAYANEHVTAYRHALVECDPDGHEGMSADELAADKARQLERIRALRLPCSAIVDSGHKSVHAIVRIDADGAEQYAERVRWLHGFLKANGLPPDPANKNPSRLTRLAGAARGGSTQKLIDVATGCAGWDEWRAWVDAAPIVGGGTDTMEAKQDAATDAETPKGAGTTAMQAQGEQAAIVEAMRADELLRVGFGTNVLDGGRYVRGPLPWDELGEPRRWSDADAEHLFCWAQASVGTKNRANVAGAFTICCAEARFNPIADMLDALPEWDETRRADYMLWVLFGCEDSAYTRAVSHAFMRGAVLRGYEPGCKFDSVLTLIGPQGCGKSLGVRRLAMHDELLCESVTDLTDHKLTAEQTAGKWLCELAELEGMTGRRLTGVKQAITMQQVTVRLAYAREPTDLPRSCVFVATTNEGQFLADPTGARRFWPIRCAIDSDRDGWARATDRQLEAFVMQAWAEVVHEYREALRAADSAEAFRSMFPTTLPRDLEDAADEARDAASVEDTRLGVVLKWLEDVRLREGVTRVCTRQVAEQALGYDLTKQRGHRVTNELAYMLDNMCPGWVRAEGKQRVGDYGTQRAWEWQGGQ